MEILQNSHLFLFIIIIIILNSNQVDLSKHEVFTNSTMIVKHRMKRQLVFQPGTRIMFRVNTKNNIIKVNQIFAHGFGFRGNIDLTQPDNINLLAPEHRMKRSVTRREVYETIGELMNQFGFDGRLCIQRMICSAIHDIPLSAKGIFSKVFKLIFTRGQSTKGLWSDDEKDYPYLSSDDCSKLLHHCPLHLFDISPFTDI
ncbi:hypothetical protein ACKWTF_011882 [Chironomus riparius]